LDRKSDILSGEKCGSYTFAMREKKNWEGNKLQGIVLIAEGRLKLWMLRFNGASAFCLSVSS
jgi:hypothetical protein